MRKIRDVFYKLEKDGQFQYLLFDLDGTLTDPKIGITSCVQHALRKFGVEEPDLNKIVPETNDIFYCNKCAACTRAFCINRKYVCINKPMMYPKGEKFQYNNSGYVLLAMIIEKVTGMYFDQYLKKNIFDVCGMESTGYYELDKLPAKCANSYIYCADTDDYRTNIFSVDAKLQNSYCNKYFSC